MRTSMLSAMAHEIDLEEGLLDAAREELLSRGSQDESRGFRFGYLLGVEDGAELPLSTALDSALRAQVVEPIARATGRGYALSFLKTTIGQPPEASEGVHFEGFHLDTHPSIREDGGPELARVLINLAQTPRRFRFARATRKELAAAGVSLHRGDYQVVALPSHVEIETIEIPARENCRMHALRFWASVVPHVGVDDAGGHFLASYEAVAPFDGAA